MLRGSGIEIILKYHLSEKRQVKVTVQENNLTQLLFDEVKKHFGIDIDSQILRSKRDRYTVKLVASWPISFYELKNLSVIEVESTDDNLDLALEESANATSEKKIGYLRKLTKLQSVTKVNNPLFTISENAEYKMDRDTIVHNRVSTVKDTNENSLKAIVTSIKKGEEEFKNTIRGNEFYDLEDSEGWRPIHYAINHRNKLATKHIMDSMADIDAVTKNGLTPLMLCIMKKEFDLFKLLIESGKTDLNKLTSKGAALHFALESKAVQFANFLIQKGADPFLENETNQTALDLMEDGEMKTKILKKKEEETNISNLKAKPSTLKGTVFKTGNFFRNLKVRYLVVNTNQRTLIRYRRKADMPDKPIEIIPLRDVTACEEVKSKMFLQHGFHYFQVTYGSKNILATKSKQLTQSWVNGIKKAVEYTKNFEKAMKLNQIDQSTLGSIDTPAEEIDMDVSKPSTPMLRPAISQTIQAPVRPNVNINLSSFEILKFLGRGSFGRVYKVKLKNNGKIYAMKVLNKELLIAKKQIKYAQSEANILKNANHPFILSLHFAFQTPTNLYMVIDYCSNGDLSLLITRDNYLTEEQTKFFAAELVLAVESLHQKNVLYRDLKPENILLDTEGHIKLADFGLSAENKGQNDIAKSFCGSHIYLAPEMAAKKGFRQESDNYGIGLCIYEMLFGNLPFYSEDIDKLHAQIRKEEVRFPSDIRVSGAAKDLMINLLKKDYKERLGTKSKDELKSHTFFDGVDWDALLRKKIKPPIKFDDQDELDVRRRVKINDRDYTEANKTVMRIKDFTFVRMTELENKLDGV